jgi:tRNA dimethylallyltransferase
MLPATPASTCLPPAPLPIIVLAGPTASGKTALAIALAQRLNGEILSADSRQIYQRSDIVTAKPTHDEQALAPHHLIDICEPHETFSAAQWGERARQVLVEVRARGAVPIVCGGTGFYIRALIEPEKIPAPASDLRLRTRLESEYEAFGAQASHARLQVLAPERAAKIHLNDRYRVLRALEIALSEAAPPHASTSTSAGASTCAPPFVAFRLAWPREQLYERIESRVDAMIEEGAWNELRNLLDSGVSRDSPALSGVGYKQMIPVLDGAMNEAEAVCLWKQESRRYAKRQETWFSNQLDCVPLDGTRGAQVLAVDVEQVLEAWVRRAETIE